MMQQLSENGAHDIRFYEGTILHAYRDSGGVLTIGEGFTWGSLAFRRWWAANRPGQKFAMGATMTRPECDECLILVMDGEYGAAVSRFFDGMVVPQNVFDVCCSVTYNAGIGSLQWKWAQAAKRGDYAESAALLTTTAITVKGRRVQGLVTRRKDEARLMKNGIYAWDGLPAQDNTPQRAPKSDPVEQPKKPKVIAPAVIAASIPVMTHWQEFSHWFWSVF
jgi:lysozyme